MKKWWTSKTLWFNAASAGLAVMEANFGMLRERMEPEHYLLAIGAFAAVNAMLRVITSQPIK